jgi:hypothetical protein
VGHEHFGVGAAFERWDAGEKLVGDDAQGVQVGALVLGTLGRQIGGRAKESRCPGDAGEVQASGDAEVGDLGGAVGTDQDVGGLDVAMDHACGVSIRETLGNLG